MFLIRGVLNGKSLVLLAKYEVLADGSIRFADVVGEEGDARFVKQLQEEGVPFLNKRGANVRVKPREGRRFHRAMMALSSSHLSCIDEAELQKARETFPSPRAIRRFGNSDAFPPPSVPPTAPPSAA